MTKEGCGFGDLKDEFGVLKGVWIYDSLYGIPGVYGLLEKKN
jgi:hypothetical protein